MKGGGEAVVTGQWAWGVRGKEETVRAPREGCVRVVWELSNGSVTPPP